METLLLLIYELAASSAPALLICMILCRAARWRPDAPRVLIYIIFSSYLFALLHITGTGTIYDAMRFGLELSPRQVSLMPLAGFFADIEGHLLNVLLFVPLGLLIPIVSGMMPGALSIARAAALTSLAVEMSQLLNSRITDIDDLLMNVIGALMGYGLLRCLCAALEQRQRHADAPGIALPAAMMAAAFIGRFLLFNEMGLARLLYGF